ncbi:hypothetical protein [Parathalassolituus penaei]|uniref:Uncharacterized protein n=1 Tax=Parathalassolituus penaei TaxID=2997323 RepID=A0A9X3EJG5_9GAMM|nr:hypothetical protein [Parathalassolituus penaei]MCY0963658.1 hypothetical protein [Parathalassolituus penaei]
MDALALNHTSRDALLALALKYESITGKRLKWRRDTDAAIEMVLDSLAHGADELFQVAVNFMETLPIQMRKEFLKLQQLDVPQGYEARVQLYRGVAHRLLKPVSSSALVADSANTTVVRHTYRGVTWEETVEVDNSNKSSTASRRVYRGQEY